MPQQTCMQNKESSTMHLSCMIESLAVMSFHTIVMILVSMQNGYVYKDLEIYIQANALHMSKIGILQPLVTSSPFEHIGNEIFVVYFGWKSSRRHKWKMWNHRKYTWKVWQTTWRKSHIIEYGDCSNRKLPSCSWWYSFQRWIFIYSYGDPWSCIFIFERKDICIASLNDYMTRWLQRKMEQTKMEKRTSARSITLML